jgi:hypothetical protein
MAARRNLPGQAAGPGDQRRGDGWHGIGEGPARRGRHQDEIANALWVVNRHFLSDHAAQAYPHHVSSADARAVKHGEDVAAMSATPNEPAGRSLGPLPRLSTSTSRKCRPRFRSTGSQPWRSNPSPESRQATSTAIAGHHAARRRSASHRCRHIASCSRPTPQAPASSAKPRMECHELGRSACGAYANYNMRAWYNKQTRMCRGQDDRADL